MCPFCKEYGLEYKDHKFSECLVFLECWVNSTEMGLVIPDPKEDNGLRT